MSVSLYMSVDFDQLGVGVHCTLVSQLSLVTFPNILILRLCYESVIINLTSLVYSCSVSKTKDVLGMCSNFKISFEINLTNGT